MAVRFVIGSILYVIIVFVGFLLLIIPGIYLAIKYQFFAVCIFDKDVSTVEGLKMSGRITKGSWGIVSGWSSSKASPASWECWPWGSASSGRFPPRWWRMVMPTGAFPASWPR